MASELLDRARTAASLWPGSVRLLCCAAGLWSTALLAPGPWALILTPLAGLLGFVLLRRHHHLGVGLIVFACLLTIQVTALAGSRGPDEDTETTGIVVGHSDPGSTGWTRLTLLGATGFSSVLSPEVASDGATVRMRTHPLDDIRSTDTAPEMIAEPNGAWRWREHLRTELRAHSLAAGNEGGRLLPGLVVGDTDPQDDRMLADMRVVSLTHISAVSGSNVTIVSLGAGLLAGACRAGPRLRVSIGVATCLGYVFIVGFEPSAIRAAGMAIAAALVFLRGGGISPVAVMCSTASLLLAFVPVLATSVGFVLSVVSTAAIMFVVPVLLRRLSVHFPLLPSVLITALVVPFVAQLACTPVLVAIDPRIGVWSVAANALAAPAVLPATVAGFLSLVSSGIGSTGMPGADFFSTLLAWLGSLPAWWIVHVARFCASLPGAALDWPVPPWGTVLALGLLVIAVVGVGLLVRRRLWGLPVLVLCVILTAAVIVSVRTKPPAADWLVLVCDVGQGSGAVINLGDGRGLVVDTGKEPGPIDTCLDESGIDEFDLLISHFDADHFAGFAGTTWGRQIDRLFVSGNVADSAEARQVITETGAEVVPAQRGQTLRVGSAAVQVLWPPLRETPAGEDEELRNEDSLVVRIDQQGLSTLLPGDVGAEEQYVLAQSIRPVDVLIAPHHGSSDLAAEFFAAADPQLGVLSVGENSYGHPTRKSVRAFGPVPVLRTDRCGSVALYAEGHFSTGRDCPGSSG
ncbi:ComEC/Rec2 family competence protein [Brevibacterium spongiae]|uniref:ComEC/Rec2 family competence protein n=1 Tax=Brevibacterium spongiae TaxID=2909672 RepID=A0ABY5SJ29_9MICO|nr:ComEC/Rec2 family competence protein [Brevibacterium spongiae]UVI34553.1 ComEC/Rec2 family competence protein [Brevibacterium spongiae]